MGQYKMPYLFVHFHDTQLCVTSALKTLEEQVFHQKISACPEVERKEPQKVSVHRLGCTDIWSISISNKTI